MRPSSGADAPAAPIAAEHPHGRGEDRALRAEDCLVPGTPPRAWGGDVRVDDGRWPEDGTPPRAWGGPTPDGPRLATRRNTPTGVGRTR